MLRFCYYVLSSRKNAYKYIQNTSSLRLTTIVKVLSLRFCYIETVPDFASQLLCEFGNNKTLTPKP